MRKVLYRIPMPVSVDEYHVGQQWNINDEWHKLESENACEIKTNEPFDNHPMGPEAQYSQGQHTVKFYDVNEHINGSIRTLLSPIVDKSSYVLHEESWNAYPYSRTVLTNPTYMKYCFRIITESIHLPDKGNHPNPFDRHSYYGFTEDIDITEPRSAKLPKELGDPSTHKPTVHAGHRRGPLNESGWIYEANPVMTCYKEVTVVCEWGLMTNTLERQLLDFYRDVLLAFHQRVWLTIDQWIRLTLEEVKQIENQIQRRRHDEKQMEYQIQRRGQEE